MSVLEIRFYLAVIASFFFFFLGVMILMLGHVLEGVSLLVVVLVFWVLASYTSAKKRCPHCGRFYIDSSYSHCPYCGGPLKSKNDDEESVSKEN